MQVVFETDLDLDTQALILSGYHRSARSVLDIVEAERSSAFIDATSHSELAISAQGRRGSPLMPAWLLEVSIPIDDIETMATNAGASFEVEDCALRFFDYGVAILMVNGWAAHAADAEDGHFVHLLRELELFSDSIPGMFLKQVSKKLEEVRRAVGDVNSKFVIESDLTAELRSAREDGDIIRSLRPLWVHRLVSIESAKCDEDELKSAVALQLQHRVNVVLESGAVVNFIPGQGTSLMLCDSATEIPDIIVEPLALLNAYFAGSTKFDEAVFWGISQLQAISHGNARHSVHSKASQILALQERVLLFRAAVDHQAHNLSPQEQVVWQKISAAWNLEPLIDGVASNVATLDGIFQHVAEGRRSEQADRLSMLVTIFTLASILGVGASLFPVIFGDPAPLSVFSRTLLLVMLTIIPLVSVGLVVFIVVGTIRQIRSRASLHDDLHTPRLRPRMRK